MRKYHHQLCISFKEDRTGLVYEGESFYRNAVQVDVEQDVRNMKREFKIIGGKMLTKIIIEGLWDERNYSFEFIDGRMILVGENGSGKTTLLKIIYYTLSRKWIRLSKEPFQRVMVFFGEDFIVIDIEQLNRLEEYGISTERSEILRSLSPYLRAMLIDEYGSQVMPHDLIDFFEKYECVHMYENVVNKLRYMEQDIPVTIKDIDAFLKKHIDFQIIYMPTYRRNEGEIYFENDKIRRRIDVSFSVSKFDLLDSMEVRLKGMSDVDGAILNNIRMIEEEYGRSASLLNLNCFKGILNHDYANVTIEASSYDPEYIEQVFSSIDINNSSIKDELLNVLSDNSEYNEYDKIVIYYYKMLVNRFEALKKKEEKLNSFFNVCNKYFSSKKFVYDFKSFNYTLQISDRNGTMRTLQINQLSSGEKQIVALFSYVYLLATKPCMVIIDEPEISLSVPWQEKILEDVAHSDYCGILVAATQSPFIYNNDLLPYAHSIEELVTWS